MDAKILQSVSREIYRRFPEVKGQKPKIEKQPRRDTLTYRLTYRGQVSTADHRSMPRWVQVIVNESGKIMRITTSR